MFLINLIKESKKMNFWCYPPYSGYIVIPLSKPEQHTQTSQRVACRLIESQERKISLKLNITRQDLQKAGYNHKRNTWTEEQDKLLLKLAKSQNLDWKSIGDKMKNRNSKMCYSRYRRLCYETKKRWSNRQQKTIIDFVKSQGQNWKKIAQAIPGRTARQIQQHYQFCLKADLNKSEWTIQQDLLLVELLEKLGTNWKNIQRQMKGRSENQIKNRYFGRLLKISEQKLSIQDNCSPLDVSQMQANLLQAHFSKRVD